MKIILEIRNENNELIAKKEALSFESAAEDLGKLEIYYNKNIKSND